MPLSTMRSTPTVPLLMIAALAASLFLSGCSGQDESTAAKEGVASLPPSADAQASPDGSSDSGSEEPSAGSTDDPPGVQLRLDDTPEKRLQVRKVYAACLEKNGMGKNANGQVSDSVRRKAEKACEDKAPIYPPELDPAKNPHYGEGVVAVVKCLTSHGVPAVIVPATDSQPVSWKLTSADVPGDYNQINSNCLVKSFGSS